LKGAFASEPKWVDLGAYRGGAAPRDARFQELGADFAAAIHGMPKEDLLSQEVRQQRRALRLAWSAAGTLLVLVGVAGWQWQEQRAQRNRAQKALNAPGSTPATPGFDLPPGIRHRPRTPARLANTNLGTG